MPKSPTTAQRSVYCPNCNLSTRPHCTRCVHCGKYITCQGQNLVKSTPIRKAPSTGRAARVSATSSVSLN